MINRAFLPYSVGSTFKVVTAAAALETLGSEYCLTREYECVGYIDVLDQRFHCHDRAGHGELDLFGAVKESCNPWFIGLGLETGGEALLRKTVQFGFGEEIRLADGITVQGGSIRRHPTSSTRRRWPTSASGRGTCRPRRCRSPG